MEHIFLERIHRNSVIISKLCLWEEEQSVKMHLEVLCKGQKHTVTFNNVSRLNIVNFSFPLEIEGLEIICYRDKGWEPESSYYIQDYENHEFSFFCESFAEQGDGSPAMPP